MAQDSHAQDTPTPAQDTPAQAAPKQRFQANVMLTLVGSKTTGERLAVTDAQARDALIRALQAGTLTVSAKDFSTGSVGFFVNGKILVGG